MIDWANKNLVLPNPEYVKKVRMGFWTGSTPDKIRLYQMHGQDLVVPYGCLRDVLRLLNSEPRVEIKNFCPMPIRVAYGGKDVPLYDYQKKAVEEAYYAQYGIIQSKAGSGKTQMGIALAKKYGRRTLWLTHTLDLLKQSKDRAMWFMDESVIGTIAEGKVEIGSGITFATVQTMSKLDLTQYRDYWDVIIVDECHRCTGTPTAVTQFSKVLNSLAARHKYGLSATVHRSDGMIKATFALLGEVVYSVPDSAVADKVMQVGIMPIHTQVGFSPRILNTDGTLNYMKLMTYLVENDDRNQVIADTIAENRGKSSLILSTRLSHLEELMNLLPTDMQRDAVMISGTMTSKSGKAAREQAIEDMRSGKKKYLFATYNLAKEGLDIPRLERLYMATPQKDFAVITQSIGRIARIYEGKADPICYDFVDEIPYCINKFKDRYRHYKKNDCYLAVEK